MTADDHDPLAGVRSGVRHPEACSSVPANVSGPGGRGGFGRWKPLVAVTTGRTPRTRPSTSWSVESLPSVCTEETRCSVRMPASNCSAYRSRWATVGIAAERQPRR
ncbi:hypothetical protein [Streptomyces sp. ISL-100]|uniref:hypothetical protein n=1 Tax=Streptomyces sp. ISL-100 TaxID=2819173 RepID=UPI001BE598B9|nr:hypothetical protein [Streptomyces sp. ISL-100]MBT2399812.1 hypothetical protein [Streptomyces sp. ISL-100]